MRLKAALERGDSLIAESTLAGKSLQRHLKEARLRGFTVLVIFVYLDSAEECIDRVRERIHAGGHSVPQKDIRRRFGRSLVNL